MNTIDASPDYRRIYNFVKREFTKTVHFAHGPFDETYYTLRVYESAKEIISDLKGINVEILLVSTLLHDIGKSKIDLSKIFGKDSLLKDFKKEWENHIALGIPITRSILSELGHSKEFIEKVCYLIENHENRKMDNNKKTVELKILQDADLIADHGFAGFIRPFLYSGKFPSQSVIGSIEYMKKSKTRLHDESILNLEISKKISKQKIKLQEKLTEEIYSEINSDLISE